MTPELRSPVLRLAGVTRAFATPAGPRPVLRGVDLEVAGGEVVVVTGRSGSGKTTLLMVAAGWEHADRGAIERPGGTPPDHAGPPSWDEVAVTPQSLGLLDELTAEENVGLPLRLQGRTGQDALASVARELNRFGIGHLAARHPTDVSLGEQQRIALARAAVVRPRLLVADEPTAHQNVELARRALAALRAVADAGSACLLATHDDLALEVADRVVALRDGRPVPAAVPGA